MNYQYTYLVKIQFLGFRFHGWQKQPNLKTVHSILDKTLKFVFKGIRYKSLGVGRTDAKVSAELYAFQLFIDNEVVKNDFIELFNKNSPADMKLLTLQEVGHRFNIIQHPKVKEYRYYFSFGEKNHPFAAALMNSFQGDLDIELMKYAAKLFKGEHYFGNYCTKPTEKTIVYRKIDACFIEKNTDLTASFFPEESYVLIVKGKGFLRNQIRLIMGALVDLGRGELDLNFIEQSLTEENEIPFLRHIAPASGLQLYDIKFFF